MKIDLAMLRGLERERDIPFEELAEIIADRTGKTVEQIDRDFDRDKWFTAEEALEYGFVDHIVHHPQSIGRMSNQEEA